MIPGAADCTFVSRQEARDSYVEQYDEDDLYSNLDPSIFRHRYVIHLTDAAQMQQVVSDLEATPGIVKVRADEAISNGFYDGAECGKPSSASPSLRCCW